MGLAGLGDLTLTCTDDQSRNRRMGLALARGLSIEAARAESLRGLVGRRGLIHGIDRFGESAPAKALAVEWAPHNIQVNAICPTVVMTEMGKTIWSPPEKSGPMIAATPLGRFGEPVEIADMALYLASPASDLVNGAIMMIEGGYSSV